MMEKHIYKERKVEREDKMLERDRGMKQENATKMNTRNSGTCTSEMKTEINVEFKWF
jgi:hypothetical protein